VSGKIKYVIVMLLLLIPTRLIFAHSLQENKEYTAIRTSNHPRVDGLLNDKIWEKADVLTGFIQDYPEPGGEPSESTHVKIAYDDDALYVAFYCFDSEPGKIIRRLARRDQTGYSDFIKIEIDSYHDHLTGYMFQISAAGILRDSYRYNDGWMDDSWDAVWSGNALITDNGWTAEMRIPYSCLRFTNHKSEQVWGVNVVRYIARKNEVLAWSYVPEGEGGWVSRFGHLNGIHNINPPSHLEVLPYVVSSGETEPKSLGNPDGQDLKSNIGVDVKYGLTSNMILDATMNPDFGQVEADPAVLNLTTYETWFSEKRPFFIEGSKYFETQFDLFYSRRIGQRPRDWPDDVDYYIRKPGNTTILGAGKITGRTDNGWVLGFMNSITDEENASYVNEDGEERTCTVEDYANYNVTRLKKEFKNGSHLGIIGTAIHQKCYNPVYSGGVDWYHKMMDKKYLWKGMVVGSNYDGEGSGLVTSFSREAGKHFVWAFGGEYESRDLNINRLGYLNRGNYHGGWLWWQYRDTENPFIFRQWYHNLNYWYGYNLDGDLISHGANYNNSLTLHEDIYTGIGFEVEPSHYDDRETRGGPLYWYHTTYAGWWWMETDWPGWLNFGINTMYGTNRDGGHESFSVWSSIKVSDRLSFTLEPAYNATWDQSRWLTDDTDADGERVDIFGELDTRTFDFSLRSTVMLSRNMSIELYSQVFLASGDYSNFKQLDPPRDFVPLTIDYDENPDFLSKYFNLNMVYRWEYIPGSTLYLVFTQARDDATDIYNSLNLDRDARDLFKLPSYNVFLVKISYWWSPS
jgi:hypothetical protein